MSLCSNQNTFLKIKWKQHVPDIFCKRSGTVQGKCYEMKDYVPFKFTWPELTGVESMDLENNSIMTKESQECC